MQRVVSARQTAADRARPAGASGRGACVPALPLPFPRARRCAGRHLARATPRVTNVDAITNVFEAPKPLSGEQGLPPSRPPEDGNQLRIAWRGLLRALANLPLAIAELAALAALSAVGTVIEQNRSPDYYSTFYPSDGPSKVLGFVTSDLILFLGVDHIYTTPYFLGLMALLGASLAACTFTRQWPTVRLSSRWSFKSTKTAIASLPLAESLPRSRLSDLAQQLSLRRFQVFVKDGKLYAFKGIVGRVAPMVVHASMLLSMTGFVQGALMGWEGSVMCPVGQEFVAVQPLSPVSMFAPLPAGSDAVVRVNDFRIDHRSDGQVGQYFSDVSVLTRDGEEVTRKTVSVNDPLRFGDITAYQTDWGIAGVQLRITGDGFDGATPLALPMASLEGSGVLQGRAWGTFLPVGASTGDAKPRGVSLIARDLQSIAIYDDKGAFVGVRRPGSGKPIEVSGVSLVVESMTGSTGLQMKTDPGIPAVYTGFGFLILSSFMSFLPFMQVYAVADGATVHVGGKTNRADEDLRRELDEVFDAVPEVTETA